MTVNNQNRVIAFKITENIGIGIINPNAVRKLRMQECYYICY